MKKKTNTKQLMILIIITCLSLTAFSQWTNISPNFPGRISSILVHQTNENIIMVASAGGGIWKTTNNGANWMPTLNYGLGDFCVLDLQWDKIVPNRILASTSSALYATTDFGDHWTCLTPMCGFPPMIKNVGSSKEPKLLSQLTYSYNASARTIFWCSSRMGIYFSNDGTSFTQLFPFSGGSNNPNNNITAIAVDKITGHLYFAIAAPVGSNAPGIYRSSTPWTPTTTSMPFWDQLSIDYPVGSNVGRITAITSMGEANKLAFSVDFSVFVKVFRTTNGTSFTMCPQQPGTSTFSPWDSRTLVSPGPNQLLLGCLYPYYSNDFGATWQQFSNTPVTHADVTAFYFASFAGVNRLWFTTDGAITTGTGVNEGLILKWNYTIGATSTSPAFVENIGVNNLRNLQTYYVEAIRPKGFSQSRIFTGTQDNGSFMSNNGGVSWQRAGATLFAADNYLMTIARTSNLAYTDKDNGTAAGMQKSNNVASTSDPSWADIASISMGTPPYCGPQIISIDPTNDQRFCKLVSNSIFMSTNGGITANPLATLPGNARPSCVYLDTDGAIYVGTIDVGVFRSDDNGVTWTAFALNTNSPKAIAKIIHTDFGSKSGTFYFATTSGLYRRSSPGSEILATQNGYSVSDVEVHPIESNKLYIGYGYGGSFTKHYGGVSYSTNGGVSFSTLSAGQNVHMSPVTDIKIDPIDHNLIYVATYGLGVWSYHL